MATPPRTVPDFDEREIDDQIAALRDAVEAELDARARAGSIVSVPLSANGHDGGPSARGRRLDRSAVARISWTLVFWFAGVGVAAIVGILVAYLNQ